MIQKECPFCEDLKNQKETDAYYKATDERHSDTRIEYKVALIMEYYDVPTDPYWCTGKHTGRHMELNYCPVCGANIKEEKKNE